MGTSWVVATAHGEPVSPCGPAELVATRRPPRAGSDREPAP
ncbi:MAG: hypothetical protein JWM05_470, partial [Acidimicrobiales bacterium]|nr:hypothetical protein [Acidimicrobiales bacterium]